MFVCPKISNFIINSDLLFFFYVVRHSLYEFHGCFPYFTLFIAINYSNRNGKENFERERTQELYNETP